MYLCMETILHVISLQIQHLGISEFSYSITVNPIGNFGMVATMDFHVFAKYIVPNGGILTNHGVTRPAAIMDSMLLEGGGGCGSWG